VSSPPPDAHVERLATLFLDHPAWITAAGHVDARATSNVYFSHRPGEVWHLVFRDGRTRLLPGSTSNPDFVFRFTPAAVERLESVEGGIGDFAVELFTLMLEEDPSLQVGFRIVGDFTRLMLRGYVRLLLAAGPRVIAFGATHGVGSLGALRRFVAQLRSRAPMDWETGGGEG
jgi:hypothetical protein